MLSLQRETSEAIARIVGNGRGWNPLEVPLIFEVPGWVTDYSAWLSHVPFAFGLVAMMRPRVVVELGVHGGDSYCAFCQAVGGMKLGGETRCVGVDTWTGDSQAGLYDRGVLEKLRGHHDALYGGFSTLMQERFDGAVSQFGEGEIDLLHIDGLHLYEAVRHDFEMWLPKVAVNGVVLLHDTQERGEGFGVWRLWEEISKGNAGENCFEFLHGHGLGVIFPKGVPEGMRGFMEAAARGDAGAVRGLFEGLGRRIEGERDLRLMRERLRREESFWGRVKAVLRPKRKT